MVPLVLVVPDLAHMRATRSPLLRYLPASVEDEELATRIHALLPAEPPVTLAADGQDWAETFGLLTQARRLASPFEAFPEAEVKALVERCQTLQCSDGQTIIVGGQDTRVALVVLEGAAEVRVDGISIARFEEGEMFGELALLLSARRLLALDDRTMQRLLTSSSELAAKLLLNVSRSLAQRLLAARSG